MDTFVARQPIFTQKEEVHAYELLFRSSLENSFGDVDGDQASAKVLVDGVLGLGMSTLTGGKAAFINFTRDLLLKDMAFLFPKEQVVIELLEDVEPDDSVFEACVRLKLQGYCLALDDFIFDPKYDALISLADIIKVDFLLSGPEERRRLPGLIKNKKIQFLAEKVESREEFEEALELGYTYFQGYFFSKPVVLSHKQIPSFKFSYLQLLQAVRVPNLDFSEIENIVKGDPALTSKLLRYINTAGRGLVTYIDSIKHSLTLLGRENLRRLFCLVVLSTVMEDRAQELLVQSLIRASVCESLAGHWDGRPQVRLFSDGHVLQSGCRTRTSYGRGRHPRSPTRGSPSCIAERRWTPPSPAGSRSLLRARRMGDFFLARKRVGRLGITVPRHVPLIDQMGRGNCSLLARSIVRI